MRLLAILAALVCLTLPAAAQAACGKPDGGVTAEGRGYNGLQTWGDGTTSFNVELRRDCSAVFSFGSGPPDIGGWVQNGREIGLFTAGKRVSYLGEVDDKGAIKGQMIDSGDQLGNFRLVTNAASMVAPRPHPPSATPCGYESIARNAQGRAYEGSLETTDGVQMYFSLALHPDCTLDYSLSGRPAATGRWEATQGGLTFTLDGSGRSFSGAFRSNGDLAGTISGGGPAGKVMIFNRPPRRPNPAIEKPGDAVMPCGGGYRTLLGSVWEGREDWSGAEQNVIAVIFRKDCSVLIDYGRTTDTSGVWSQDGVDLTIRFNGGYSVWRGKIGKVHIEGTLQNQQGRIGAFRILLKP
jgi:hypothetical protein